MRAIRRTSFFAVALLLAGVARTGSGQAGSPARAVPAESAASADSSVILAALIADASLVNAQVPDRRKTGL